MEATQDDSIFQHISINKFPIIHWIPLSDDARSFLTHCFHKQNPESLFRQGMVRAHTLYLYVQENIF